MADLPIDQQYVDAIKGFEGFTPRAQWDVNNHRNGYGTNALYPTETIDKDEAHRRLTNELGSSAALVDGQFPNLAPGQRAALTSLTFNAGPKWMGEGLGNAVRNGDWTAAKQGLLNYNHSEGKVNDGLTKRRAAEAAWLGGDGDTSLPVNAAMATGSAPATRGSRMPAPMDDAMGSNQGLLSRLLGLSPETRGVVNNAADNAQQMAAWLGSANNPAGSAALLNATDQNKLLKANRFMVHNDAFGRPMVFDSHRGTMSYPLETDIQGNRGGASSPADILAATPDALKKRAELQATNDAKTIDAMSESERTARSIKARADEMMPLINDPNVVQGTGGEAAATAKNIPLIGGLLSSGGPQSATLSKKMAEANADFMAMQKGIRVAGPEIKFSQSANAGLDKPRETNAQIVQDHIRKADLTIEANRQMREYYQKHGNLGGDWPAQLSKLYAEQAPSQLDATQPTTAPRALPKGVTSIKLIQ